MADCQTTKDTKVTKETMYKKILRVRRGLRG